MYELIAIALGGALGAISRYLVVGLVTDYMGKSFPFGTMTVNITGSFFIGMLYVLVVQKLHLAPELKAILVVGFLGSFTTFSTFSLETFSLIERGHFTQAGIYLVGSVVLGLLAVWAGITAGKFL
jgi:CrcB protein